MVLIPPDRGAPRLSPNLCGRDVGAVAMSPDGRRVVCQRGQMLQDAWLATLPDAR
jgi:hypothetical protein